MIEIVVEGFRNFKHLVLFNVHWQRIVHGPLAFLLHRNVATTAGIRSHDLHVSSEVP